MRFASTSSASVERLCALDEIAHHEVVASRGRMLIVRDGIHAARVGQLPGFRSQPFDGCERRRREHPPVFGSHDENEVVVLHVHVLDRVQKLEIGVLLAEEHAVVVAEPQEANPAGRRHDGRQEDRNDPPPLLDDPASELLGHVCHSPLLPRHQPPTTGLAARDGSLSRFTRDSRPLGAPVVRATAGGILRR